MAAADPATDAARHEVLSARDELHEELVRLEAAARAAVDVKARIRRSPAKAAAVVGGASFLVLGGPGRVLRGVKRALRGPSPVLPTSMLPEEIEKAVRSLGDDGDKVRGVLEREFADFVTANKKADRRFWRNAIVGAMMPIGRQVARVVAGRVLQPDEQRFGEWIDRIRERRPGATATAEPSAGDAGEDRATG